MPDSSVPIPIGRGKRATNALITRPKRRMLRRHTKIVGLMWIVLVMVMAMNAQRGFVKLIHCAASSKTAISMSKALSFFALQVAATPTTQTTSGSDSGTRTLATPLPTRYFTCGYPFDHLFYHFYPEMRDITPQPFPKIQPSKEESVVNDDDDDDYFQPNDILLFGQHGPCHGWGPKEFQKYFPGTTVILNGEPYESIIDENNGIFGHDLVVWDRSVVLGYRAHDDNWRSVQVLYAAVVLHTMPSSVQERLWMPQQKPVNTGQRFLIYAVSNPVPFRQAAFDKMAEIDVVYQGGKTAGLVYNSTNSANVRRVPEHELNHPWTRNYEMFAKYKFCLVMENTNQEGYITEKILNAFLGGCIPIYYGTTQVFDVFNAKAFVYYDIHNPQPAIDKVRHLHANPTAYHAVLAQPILVPGAVEKYFSLSDDVGGGRLRQKIRAKIEEARAAANRVNDC